LLFLCVLSGSDSFVILRAFITSEYKSRRLADQENRSYYGGPIFSVNQTKQIWHNRPTYVHSVKQKSIALKFSKSRTGSDMRYSCHHNSSRFTFPILAHSWRFSVFYYNQSHRVYINRRQEYICLI
jgi:hypothetical protein